MLESVFPSRCRVLALSAAVLGSAAVGTAEARTEQQLAVQPALQQAAVGSVATVTVVYDADDTTVAGVAARLHYDSTKITLDGARLLYSPGIMGHQDQLDAGSAYADQYDDGNPATDRRYLGAWSDLQATWPGDDVDLPLPLLELRFRVKSAFGSTDLTLTGNACGGCTLAIASATIRTSSGALGIVDPTPSAPSATTTPTPSPPQILGPADDAIEPHGITVQGIPTLSDLGALLFGAALAACAIVLLLRRRG